RGPWSRRIPWRAVGIRTAARYCRRLRAMIPRVDGNLPVVPHHGRHRSTHRTTERRVYYLWPGEESVVVQESIGLHVAPHHDTYRRRMGRRTRRRCRCRTHADAGSEYGHRARIHAALQLWRACVREASVDSNRMNNHGTSRPQWRALFESPGRNRRKAACRRNRTRAVAASDGRPPHPARTVIPIHERWAPCIQRTRHPKPPHGRVVIPRTIVERQPAPRFGGDPRETPAGIIAPHSRRVGRPTRRFIRRPTIPVAWEEAPGPVRVKIGPAI